LNFSSFFGSSKRVGATEYELLALDQLGDYDVDLRCISGARRRAMDTSARRTPSLRHPSACSTVNPLLEHGVRLLDLSAAARAPSVAGETTAARSRRAAETLIASQLLSHQVGPDAQGLTSGQWH